MDEFDPTSTDVPYLQHSVRELQERLRQLGLEEQTRVSTTVFELQREVARLQALVATHERTIGTLQANVSQLETNLATTTTKLSKAETNIEILMRERDQKQQIIYARQVVKALEKRIVRLFHENCMKAKFPVSPYEAYSLRHLHEGAFPEEEEKKKKKKEKTMFSSASDETSKRDPMTRAQRAVYIALLVDFFKMETAWDSLNDTGARSFSFKLANYVSKKAEGGNKQSHPKLNKEYTLERLKAFEFEPEDFPFTWPQFVEISVKVAAVVHDVDLLQLPDEKKI